jgi:uncharacterized protein related to proFAR isomerase
MWFQFSGEQMFDVIPVIDVRYGVAVRAVAGDRANYKPLSSPLVPGPEPCAVARGLMAFHPFPVIYIADLDGVEGRGANLGLLSKLAGIAGGGSTRPALGTPVVWADTGACTMSDVVALLEIPLVCAVVGSETGIGAADLAKLKARFGDRMMLSLDFRGDRFVGDPAVLADPTFWPKRVIAMTLASVGRGAGPDLNTISDLKRRSPVSEIYAAGGIRNRADLGAAQSAGATGALIASALHAQTLTAGDLVEITGRQFGSTV